MRINGQLPDTGFGGDGAGAGEGFEDGGEVGFPQFCALVVEADGEGQVAGLVGRLPDFEIGFCVDQIFEQREQEGAGCIAGLPGSAGKLFEGLGFEPGAFGLLPNAHEDSGVGFGGEAVFAEPVNAG